MGGMQWIYLAKGKDKWRIFVKKWYSRRDIVYGVDLSG
jgi:hypothetical protein